MLNVIQELPKSGSTAGQDRLGTSIRIDVDAATDDRLEAWADHENRSKREHVSYMVRLLMESYEADPFILHRLALGRASRSA